MKGMLWRCTWDRLDKTGVGNHDFAFLDACFNASDAHNKDAGLQVISGKGSPPSFFDLPGAKQIISGADSVPSTIPWDPVFQAQWEETQTALAARYKNRSHLKYVVISGPGIGSESFLALTPEQWALADTLASELGYPDRTTAWKAGVQWIIDMYVRVWRPIPVVLVTGLPYGVDDPNSDPALRAMFAYGNSTYPGLFGSSAHDLTHSNPHAGQLSADVVQLTSPNCSASVFQFGNHQIANDPAPPSWLDAALNIGTDFGAHAIEVFADDADDSRSGRVLDAANARMFGTPLPPLPSPTPSGTPGGNPDGPSFPSGGFGKPNWWPPSPDVIPPWL